MNFIYLYIKKKFNTMERKIYSFESFLINECGKGDKPEAKDEKCEECGNKECNCGDDEEEEEKKASKKYDL